MQRKKLSLTEINVVRNGIEQFIKWAIFLITDFLDVKLPYYLVAYEGKMNSRLSQSGEWATMCYGQTPFIIKIMKNPHGNAYF